MREQINRSDEIILGRFFRGRMAVRYRECAAGGAGLGGIKIP